MFKAVEYDPIDVREGDYIWERDVFYIFSCLNGFLDVTSTFSIVMKVELFFSFITWGVLFELSFVEDSCKRWRFLTIMSKSRLGCK